MYFLAGKKIPMYLYQKHSHWNIISINLAGWKHLKMRQHILTGMKTPPKDKSTFNTELKMYRYI